MDDVIRELTEALDEARLRVSDCERRALELMFHRALLQRAGADASASHQRLDLLERELAELRAEREFAEQRLLFRTRSQKRAPAAAANAGDRW